MFPCSYPRCPELLPMSGYCRVHQRDRGRLEGSRTARGYDERYQRLRLWFMKQPDNVLCRYCLREGHVEIATDCDHIVPFRGLHDPLRLDPHNLQPLCARCHGRKHRLGRSIR
jgi:5-methylcytosine-specific restriction enzyme A